MRNALVLVFLLGACPSPKKPEPVTCKSIAPKLTEAQVAEVQAHGGTPEMAAETRASEKLLEPQFVQACLDDKWSAEIISCIDKAQPLEIGSSCQTMMSAEQIDAFQRIHANAGATPPPPP